MRNFYWSLDRSKSRNGLSTPAGWRGPALRLLALSAAVFTLVQCSCRVEQAVPPELYAEPDTTTQNFTWEDIPLGDSHTYLADIYAISDTDVWVVGDITTRDASNKLIHNNIGHWDGREWKITALTIKSPDSNPPRYYIGIIETVFGLSSNEVYLYSSGNLLKWNGVKFTSDPQPHFLENGIIRRIWASSNRNLYLVGDYGTLLYYDGANFTKCDAGTSYRISDVWGVGDTALCIASTGLDVSDSHMYELVKGNVRETYQAGMQRGMHNLWYAKGRRGLTLVGGYYRRWNGLQWIEENPSPLKYYYMGVRGTAPNNMFVVDQSTGVAHFNGRRWATHMYDQIGDNFIHALTCTRNQVWVCGSDKYGHGIIIHGTRR